MTAPKIDLIDLMWSTGELRTILAFPRLKEAECDVPTSAPTTRSIDEGQFWLRVIIYLQSFGEIDIRSSKGSSSKDGQWRMDDGRRTMMEGGSKVVWNSDAYTPSQVLIPLHTIYMRQKQRSSTLSLKIINSSEAFVIEYKCLGHYRDPQDRL